MHIITDDKQRLIIDAYFRILQENPEIKDITIKMLASKSGMSRESIYRYHFGSIEEIKERICLLADGELEEETKKFLSKETHNLSIFLSKILLPYLYEKRDWLKILYNTDVEATWRSYLLKKYTPVVEDYLDKIGKRGVVPNAFLASIIVKECLAIISTWLTDPNPEPASLFKEKFLHIFKSSPYDLLISDAENKL